MAGDEAVLRSAWRERWFSALFEFASSPLQARSWLNADPSKTSSPIECVSRYFDDLSLGGEDGYKRATDEGLVSPAEADLVAHFHEVASGYLVADSAREVLDDPKWAEVTSAARNAWRALVLAVIDPKERQMMKGLEQTWGI